MPAVCLHDRAAIEAVLRRNPELHIYALGDLDDFLWPHTTWYGWQQGDELQAVCLLFSAFNPPHVLAVCDDDGGPLRELLTAIRPTLPAQFYLHVSAAVRPAVAAHYALESHGTHLRMALRERARLEALDTTAVVPLSTAELEEVRALYAVVYPQTRFELLMLARVPYCGLRVAGRLVSIAGVHVYSARYHVAALGNIATHPAHRGRGYAAATTAALCRRLLGECDCIGLNVKADNRSAIRCYERLGFVAVAEYEECTARLRPT